MGRRVVFALFALFAVANVVGAVEATADAVREPSLHSWLVGGYWVLAGEALALAGVAWLLAAVLAPGRCFGILPEARGLVTRGPDRLVRHPVYLGELAAMLRLVLGALWNLVCFVIACAAQRVRMGLEERALTREFPEHEAYAARTPRLIPWAARRRAPYPSTVPAHELGAS